MIDLWGVFSDIHSLPTTGSVIFRLFCAKWRHNGPDAKTWTNDRTKSYNTSNERYWSIYGGCSMICTAFRHPEVSFLRKSLPNDVIIAQILKHEPIIISNNTLKGTKVFLIYLSHWPLSFELSYPILSCSNWVKRAIGNWVYKPI